MKVLLAGYLLGQGGIQNHVKWLATALGEAGVETLVISLGNKQPSPSDLQHLQRFEGYGVRFIYCVPYKSSGFPWGLSRLYRLSEITALINEFSPDVYLAIGTGWNLFIPPLLSRTKARRIFHEVMSGVPNDWWDSRWVVRWHFDEVLGQSPSVAKTFAKCFGWRKPVHALPAMPEPLEVTSNLPQAVLKTVPQGQTKAALFSRLVPHKQAFWLVQQWDVLQEFLDELHIHGTGPEEALIHQYIAARGIGDRVKCFGSYPEGQAYVDLLSQYDLTLLPTIGAEGAPLVLLESMACGVPFVAYAVGGIQDYGVDNPNVLIVPPEPNMFISGVKQMACRLARGEIDQAHLQQFYLEHYSYSVLKKAWLSFLCNK